MNEKVRAPLALLFWLLLLVLTMFVLPALIVVSGKITEWFYGWVDG